MSIHHRSGPNPVRGSALGVIIGSLILAAGAAGPAHAGPIHEAVRMGNPDLVTRLLADDAALASVPDETDQCLSQPLHLAAIQGNVEVARALLAAGAELECGDSDGSTPLDNAALRRHPDMVAFLLAQGADPNRRDRNGGYPLSFAVSGGDSTCVAMVLAAGADLDYRNEQGITLLHFAASRGLNPLCERLLAAGADINARTRDGDTPLHWTAMGRSPEMIGALLARGAAISATNDRGQTPLMSAVGYERWDAVRALVENGAETIGADRFGWTALHLAAARSQPDIVRLLIDHGADVNHQDSRGGTPLHRAAAAGASEMVATLLGAGAKPGVRDGDFGRTALHWAAARGYRDVAEALLVKGADPERADDLGATPLQYASRYAHTGVTDLLTGHGAKAGKTDRSRRCGLGERRPPAEGEAYVWSLEHSGWAVQTANHLLIFDYFLGRDRQPDEPSLCNGRILPAEIASEDVKVFASHGHGDHFDPTIFGWREQIPRITYVCGFEPPDAPAHEYLPPRQTRTIDGMTITTIESNDSGVGFVVAVDGVSLFHAGDHANRQRDFSAPYKSEIDWLAAQGVRPDLCFLPISGCGFGDQVAVKMGVHYALETLRPEVFFPMHGGTATWRYRDFIAECRDQFPDTQMMAATNRGDFFHYRKGEVSVVTLLD